MENDALQEQRTRKLMSLYVLILCSEIEIIVLDALSYA